MTGRDNNADGIFNDRPDAVGRNTLRGSGQTTVNLMVGYMFAFGLGYSGHDDLAVLRQADGGQRHAKDRRRNQFPLLSDAVPTPRSWHVVLMFRFDVCAGLSVMTISRGLLAALVILLAPGAVLTQDNPMLDAEMIVDYVPPPATFAESV